MRARVVSLCPESLGSELLARALCGEFLLFPAPHPCLPLSPLFINLLSPLFINKLIIDLPQLPTQTPGSPQQPAQQEFHVSPRSAALGWELQEYSEGKSHSFYGFGAPFVLHKMLTNFGPVVIPQNPQGFIKGWI